jgi:cytochrome c553
MHEPDPEHAKEDRRFAFGASLTIGGVIVVSLVLAFVALPLAQAPNGDLDAWTAICRSVGLLPGTPAQRQPVSRAKADPVSKVEWSPATLTILASGDTRLGASVAADLCAACHGEEGLSISNDFPRLAGQSPAAIYKQLSDYRSGARFDAQMTPMAQALSQEQLAQVAAYYGQVRARMRLGGGRLDIDDPDIDRLIHRGDPARKIAPCESCHARGAGGPPETPVIAGQNAAYLERQMRAFKTGERRNDVYRRMREISAGLSDGEIRRVASHYEGTY